MATAAFLTGRPLRIRGGDYRALGDILCRRLQREGVGWCNPRLSERNGTYESGGGFATEPPLVIARREGPQLVVEVTEHLESETGRGERFGLPPGCSVTVVAARIDVYDLGVAVIAVTLRFDLPPDLPLSESASTVKSSLWLRAASGHEHRPPLAEALSILAAQTTDQFRHAVELAAPEALDRPWLDLDDGGEDERGRLLWIHPVFITAASSHEAVEETAKALAPPFHSAIDIPDGRLVPGIGWSAIVTTAEPGDVAFPLHLIELQWAFIALHMEVDRGLLGLLNNERWHQAGQRADLEADADHVFADYLRVSEARARADTTLAGLGGDEQAIWDEIAHVTRYDALITGVDRKLVTLGQLADRRVQQASSAQARRTTAILSFLTALTVVTVAVALISNFIGNRSDPMGNVEWRAIIIASAFIVSIGLYREAFKERTRRRRR